MFFDIKVVDGSPMVYCARCTTGTFEFENLQQWMTLHAYQCHRMSCDYHQYAYVLEVYRRLIRAA